MGCSVSGFDAKSIGTMAVLLFIRAVHLAGASRLRNGACGPGGPLGCPRPTVNRAENDEGVPVKPKQAKTLDVL